MKKILAIFLGCAVFLAACNPGDFGSTNDDPTKVIVAPTKALLANAIQVNLPLTVYNGYSVANDYVQYLTPGTSRVLYGTRNSAWSSSFREDLNIYAGPLANLQRIIDLNNSNDPMADNTNGHRDNQLAVARILKAYYFWWMTDRYGDIPYSEALKGTAGGANFSPRYDPQKDIYYDLFKELKEATTQIKTSELPVAGDVLFKGNMNKWKMFANTCRMMMALRLIKNDYAKGKTEFTEALAGGVLTGNADNVMYVHLANEVYNNNPLYTGYSVAGESFNGQVMTNSLVDYMKSKDDPRLPVYGEDLGGEVKGCPYGIPQTSVIGFFSRPGRSACTNTSCPSNFFRAPGAPTPIFTYAQVLFTLAEAVKVGYITGTEADAENYYADAIKASFEYYGVYNSAGYADYMANPDVAYDPANGLEQIMSQKWVHMFLQANEAWSDYRRTGFPALVPAANGEINIIPRREGYPVDEPQINGARYQEAVQRQGPDDLRTRMWWDK